MTNRRITSIALISILSGFNAQAGEVTATFNSGDTLTATDMNEIRDAVNDNDTRVDTNITDIGNNSANINANSAGISANDAAIQANSLSISRFFGGDGSAGDLIVASDIDWTLNANAPANPNFADITIDAGRTLTVPAGTTLRCSGSFVNNGTIEVEPNQNSDTLTVGFPSDINNSKRMAGAGDALRAASVPVVDNNFGGNFYMQGGFGGDGLPRAKALTSYNNFRVGGGGSTGQVSAGGGGGLFKVQCNGSIQNNGSITAKGDTLVGGGAIGTGGGGGGGIVILAAMQSVENSATGVIDADGAPGSDAISNHGAGGGGGGGIIILTAPNVTNSGILSVAGGAAGDNSANLLPEILYRFGGGAGGASGGDGGNGGDVDSSGVTAAAQAGSDGYVIQIPAVPLLN